ncbi:EamA family transporter [Streptomyces sp. MAR4 CNX-425]|uniref:EamA family transporter n=1 Tax=Streptomyces sp. MAR4 CNX-425 TaxID=3406343 RepID=UPI003B501D5F
MIAVLLALGAAVGWGISDFVGGLKSRTVPLPLVLLVSQGVSLAVLTATAVVRAAPLPDTRTLALAALAGLGEVVGIAALYRGLAVGTMSIVAPVAALAPVVPLLAGLAAGEVPGPLHLAGLGLALAGLVVTAYAPGAPGTGEGDGDGDGPAGARLLPSLLYGGTAALGFGTFFFTMGSATEGDVGWALFTARLTAVLFVAAAVAAALVARGRRVAVAKTDLPAIALIGVLVVTADSLYAFAATRGLVGVVAVLGSLHTVVTIAMARVVLRERLARTQRAGVATSLLGVLALSAA